MVGTAIFLSKTTMMTLKGLGILLIVMLGFLVSLNNAVMKFN